MTHILAIVISWASKICLSSLTVNVYYFPELDPPSLVHCLQWCPPFSPKARYSECPLVRRPVSPKAR